MGEGDDAKTILSKILFVTFILLLIALPASAQNSQEKPLTFDDIPMGENAPGNNEASPFSELIGGPVIHASATALPAAILFFALTFAIGERITTRLNWGIRLVGLFMVWAVTLFAALVTETSPTQIPIPFNLFVPLVASVLIFFTLRKLAITANPSLANSTKQDEEAEEESVEPSTDFPSTFHSSTDIGALPVNSNQRIAIATFIVVILGMMLFPPFHIQGSAGEINLGYGFLLNPPEERNMAGSVNILLLLTQLLAATIVAFSSLILLSYKEKPKN